MYPGTGRYRGQFRFGDKKRCASNGESRKEKAALEEESGTALCNHFESFRARSSPSGEQTKS
jgi:hypothetical protein